MVRLAAFLIVLAAVIGGGWYALSLQALPDDVVARIDGVDVPVKSLDVLVDYGKRRKPEITRRQMLSGVIESQVLSGYAEQHHDDHHHDGSRVDYSPETLYENELFRILRVALADQISEAARVSGSTDPFAFLSAPLELQEEGLRPMLDIDNLLYHEMTEEQAEAARHYVLARYRFPGGEEQDLTLWDLYSRQNIQLKVQMHEMNLEFMEQAVKQFLATQFVLDWFRRQSSFTDQERAALERMVSQRMTKEELLHDMGLMHDIHDDNPALRKAMESVTPEEVKAYYDEHKEEFTRVEKVKARHIRLGSQEEADQLYRRLKAGALSFSDAIIQYSTAADKLAPVPGDLGWIDRENRHSDWVLGIAFVQPQGVTSPPFRSPQQDGEVYWEILYLDEKVMGYQPWDSEGVRYEASKAVGRQKLTAEFEALRARLLEQADVQINETLLEPEA